MIADSPELRNVKDRTWFYHFNLPDGTVTKSDISDEIDHIHVSRLEKLENIIKNRVNNPSSLSAIDFASHEGFFTVAMAQHFRDVRGFEIRDESLAAAKTITNILNIRNITYEKVDLQKSHATDHQMADFVLLYGLLYHVENPIHTLRLACDLCRNHLLIETQIFPFDISGKIEDGHYRSQRAVHGVFSLSIDYANRREGGSTDIALIPSLNAVLHLLKIFGFEHTEVLPAPADDYEQFCRGSRVIIYAARQAYTGEL